MEKTVAVLFPIALEAILFASAAGAREPTPIKTCQTISQPGSYELANNLTSNGNNCLVITADFVTIDLAGFSITDTRPEVPNPTTAIAAGDNTRGIAVRNGSISSFGSGVDLAGDGSLVEGLRVICGIGGSGIGAKGIVKSNTVEGCGGPSFDRGGPGIFATGIVTGNFVTGSVGGMSIGRGSTVTGNTVTDTLFTAGISVGCPSNVSDNTVVNINIFQGMKNLIRLDGEGCNNTNNVAP